MPATHRWGNRNAVSGTIRATMKFLRDTLSDLLRPEPATLTQRGTAFVLFSVALSVVWVVAMANWPASNGRTAAFLSVLQVMMYLAYVAVTRDAAMGRLVLFGAVFGVVELVADALCVHYTGTLDYTPSQSVMVWASPWWMPLAWMIVAIQIGYLGALTMARFGYWSGAFLTALLGAVNIPFYEEMAYHAHWWQYVNCKLLWHTPYYIIVAELLIGLALGVLATVTLRESSRTKAVFFGLLGGLSTVAGGLVGYGLVEFLPGLLP